MESDGCGEKSVEAESNLQLSRRKLRNNADFDLVLFTDGSVAEGGVNGGAAVVVARDGWNGLQVLKKIERPAGRICSSYHAELVAIREGLRWLIANSSAWMTARIVSDSKSALESVARYHFSGFLPTQTRPAGQRPLQTMRPRSGRPGARDGDLRSW